MRLTVRDGQVSDSLAARIEEVLRPLIGSVLATVSVDVELKRIGRSPESVTAADLPRIADNLGEALRLVVGPGMAEAAAQRVREIA